MRGGTGAGIDGGLVKDAGVGVEEKLEGTEGAAKEGAYLSEVMKFGAQGGKGGNGAGGSTVVLGRTAGGTEDGGLACTGQDSSTEALGSPAVKLERT